MVFQAAHATSIERPAVVEDLKINEVRNEGAPVIDQIKKRVITKRGGRVVGEQRRALSIILPALRQTFIEKELLTHGQLVALPPHRRRWGWQVGSRGLHSVVREQ